jgi:hypothetical protein
VKKVWEVPKEKLNFDLPEGFSLWEDEHFLYLKEGTEIIARFLIGAKSPLPQDILSFLERYSKK